MECYFFGTFNPPHIGHINLAKKILDEFNFDKIIFVPSNVPPHKKEFIDGCHRFNMLKLLENNKIKVSDIELKMEPPSYTYKTIKKLYKGEKINFLIGFDAFKDIETWKNPEFLKEKLHFIVLKRKGDKREEIEKLALFGYDFIIADNIDMVDISSSEIRKKLENNEDISGLIDEKIKRYIDENGLYR